MLSSTLFLVTALLSTAFANSPSLYEIKTPWQQQDGRSVALSSLDGQPVLISMVYTGCAHTCPLTLKKLQKIASEADANSLAPFKIVLASFDTDGDRPADLKRYLEKNKLDPKRWTLLSATQDATVRELAVALGISYKKLAKTDFSHSNVITLLDSHGVILYRLEGLSSDSSPMIATWKKTHSK